MDHAYWELQMDPLRDDKIIVSGWFGNPNAGWVEPPQMVKDAMKRLNDHVKDQKNTKHKKPQTSKQYMEHLSANDHRCGALKQKGGYRCNKLKKGHNRCHLH